MRKALLLLVVIAGFVAGCDRNEEEVDPALMGYDYYPLEIGDYRIYKVTDIRFQHNVGDTTRFQLMERVDTSFYDQTDKLNYKIIRSVRPDENSGWVEDSVFVVSKQSTKVMLTKDNTRYVKLVFPIKDGVSWLGDAYNDHKANIISRDPNKRAEYYLDKDPSIYHNKRASYTLMDKTYLNTVTVIQGYPSHDGVGLDDRKEVYAEGVGLIYKIFNRVMYTPCSIEDCVYGEKYKIHGHERHEELISHGNE
ncbi:hypothetical protein ACFS7Z_01140 [Pontibacter toksunensis]|uniref:DKNYY family protein n=1 Tax=Pontibacter toksunensis TaxID=1332631 RepID=A0ABW6BM40_9BACT